MLRRKYTHVYTLEGYIIVDRSDLVVASPVGVAATTFRLNNWLQWIGQRHLQDETRNIYVFVIWCDLHQRFGDLCLYNILRLSVALVVSVSTRLWVTHVT